MEPFENTKPPWTWLRMTLCVLLGVALAGAAEGTVETIGNGIYEVHVTRTPARSIGSWNAVTAFSHPVGPGKDLLFRESQTGTNFSSLRVYGDTTRDYTFGGRGVSFDLDVHVVSEGPSPLAPPGRGWRTVWRIPREQLEIVQDLIVVGTSAESSAIYHTVEIGETNGRSVRVGWRNLYDWSLHDAEGGPGDDGPANALEALCGQPGGATTDEFTHAPVTSQVVRVLDPDVAGYQPLLALTHDPGLLSGIPVTPPEEYAYVDWNRANSTAFDDTLVGGHVNDSAGLSWFGRTAQTALRIEPQGTVRMTQALFAQPPQGCLKRCVTSGAERLLCVPGQPGVFEYDLIVYNRTGAEIHGIGVVAPPGVTATLGLVPDRLPIPANHGRRLKITLSGAASGEVVPLTLVFLDAAGNPLCTFEKFVRLPDCDCAQITRSSPPQCFGFGPSDQFTDTFELENLLGPVHHVVLTPVSPAGATLTPDVFHQASALGVGDRRSITTRIGGVAPGGEVCYRVSTHDADLSECCSIVRCVTVPRCTIDIVDFHELGGGRLARTPAGLLDLSNLGASGEDGVSIDVGGAMTWDGEWLPVDLATLPVGASLGTVVRGQVDDDPNATIVTMTSRVTEEGLEINADFGSLASDRHTFELLLASEVVATVSGQPALLPALPEPSSSITTDSHYTWGGPTPASLEGIDCVEDDGFVPMGCRFAGFTFSKPLLFTPFALAGAAVLADEVRVYPEESATRVGALTEVRIQAARIPQLTLTSSNAGFDCNGNGVSDFEDILGTESSDGDDNGVPDECEQPAVCAPGSERLCLAGGRFSAEVEWHDFAGNGGRGRTLPLTRDNGAFWFFDAENLELAVKVLDGGDVNGHWWVFLAALTNVEYHLTVTDNTTGVSRIYSNPLGTFASVADTRAFFGPGGASTAASTWLPPLADASVAGDSAVGACTAGAATLCLHSGRFQVVVDWRVEGQSRSARALPITDQSGAFWFFGDDNLEVVVKVLDGRPINGRWWLFVGGLSDVEYTVTVTDTATGATSRYDNPRGELASAADLSAF